MIQSAAKRCMVSLLGILVGLHGATSVMAAPGWDDSVTSRTNLCYGNPDGQKLLLDVFLPAQPAPTGVSSLRPAILFVHGGGWVGGDKGAHRDNALWFARRGFVGFSIDYRLVKPQGNQWPAQLEDVQLAVRWIREHASDFGVDPKRIGAMGDSAGGHLVSLLGTCDTRDATSATLSQHSSRVACVVDIYGPSDLTVPLPTTGPFGINVQKLVDDLLGNPPEARKLVLAREASPLFYVNGNASPFLIYQGDKDPLVPLDQSTRLHEALQKAGVDSTLVVMKDEGHGLRPENLARLRRDSLEFFRKHLGSPTP